MSDEFKDFVIKGPELDLEFAHIGEGINGDFNPDDPKDEQLVRLTLFNKTGEAIEDASYCTSITTDITPVEAQGIADKIFDLIERGNNPRVTMQKASFYSNEDGRPPNSVHFIKEDK